MDPVAGLGNVVVYNLPLNSEQIGVPLHEHTAFILATGLLLDDLDDRQDTLRGALEIDALLAIWTVCAAHERDRAKLASLGAACRWLAHSVLATVAEPTNLLGQVPLSPAARAAWRGISIAAISTGRRARRRCVEANVLPRNAFWWGVLCGAKHALDELNKLNGHSPLRGLAWNWPGWIKELEQRVSEATAEGSVELSIRSALADTGTEDEVSAEEQQLWFRPYPEFQLLVPSLLQKLNRLHRLEEHFDETLQAEKLASLQQLAYGASHEINNPLANISTRAQTLVYNEADSERRKKLLTINEQAFRAYEMLADLMLFAKPPRLKASNVCLDDLLTDVRTELAEDAHRSGVRIDLLLGDQQIQCRLDPIQIALAIKAICLNGIEAMTDGGELTVEAAMDVEEGTAIVAVTDTGSGLGETARRHLFDPFYSGREAGRGLGFGLSKAWRIVDQHRGRITVDSRPSRGSRFTVILPLEGPQVLDPFSSGEPPTSPNERSSNASL